MQRGHSQQNLQHIQRSAQSGGQVGSQPANYIVQSPGSGQRLIQTSQHQQQQSESQQQQSVKSFCRSLRNISAFSRALSRRATSVLQRRWCSAQTSKKEVSNTRSRQGSQLWENLTIQSALNLNSISNKMIYKLWIISQIKVAQLSFVDPLLNSESIKNKIVLKTCRNQHPSKQLSTGKGR